MTDWPDHRLSSSHEGALTLDPTRFSCVMHTYHAPRLWVLEEHHVVPQAWTKAVGAGFSRTVPLCPTGHYAVHDVLNDRVAGRPALALRNSVGEGLVEEALAWWRRHH